MKRDRLEEGKNTLTQWGGMQKAQMTKELEEDLQVLKLRKWLNPKAMYKKEGKKMAKYFQVIFFWLRVRRLVLLLRTHLV